MKDKILIISSHFSTGGAPQCSVKKVELLKHDFEIKVVEYSFLAYQFVIQRNRIIDLVGLENFHSLIGDKSGMLKKIIEDFSPNIISMEEFPEMFMNKAIADWIYSKDRTYKIFETTHDSSFNHKNKVYTPDEFVFVSAFNALVYKEYDIPINIVEYPVDKIERNKFTARQQLGLEHDFKHVVIIGLFTPRKNQKYAFELAERVKDYKIKFHFLGNQADNFAFYWKPLMDKKTENCIIWGERSDTEIFLQAADLFLFSSKGDRGNKELNPLVLKEAAKYQDLPKLMFNLDVYLNKYNNIKDYHFLSDNVENDVEKLLNLSYPNFKKDQFNKELIIIGTYPNLKKREQLTIECINSLKPLGRKILLISHYPVSKEIQNMVDYYVFDGYNPLTHHSYYTRFYNITDQYHAEININGLKDSNQSLTVLTNLYNGFKFANSLGYKSAFYITYDVIVKEKDYKAIEKSFRCINDTCKAYLSTLNTPFGKGIQTTAMTFSISFFIQSFHDIRDGEAFNNICGGLGAQNFLEDYMMKVVNKWDAKSYILINNQAETFLIHSGLGVSSNSEYYSILPVKGKENTFVFYFFTYNIDERKVKLYIDDKSYHFVNTIEIAKNREYMHEFTFLDDEVLVTIEFYDGENMYKREQHSINRDNIDKYNNTGHFTWKRRPKIKLVHLQTTLNNEKEQKSREEIQKVSEYGWEYVLHTNVPYADLPPKHNCQRPDCVSHELFDEPTIQRIGTAITKSHFGCYESFKNAILSEFDSEYDFLILCEGDCKIEIPIEDFIKTVESTCPSIVDNNIGFMSYGDKSTLEHGWLQSPVIREIPNQDLLYITNHIIGLQCIMFPVKVKKWLKDQLRTHKYDAADMYFNSIFVNSPYRMAILHNRITSQFDGYSTIDQTDKKFI